VVRRFLLSEQNKPHHFLLSFANSDYRQKRFCELILRLFPRLVLFRKPRSIKEPVRFLLLD
jgi:hypothetical protein